MPPRHRLLVALFLTTLCLSLWLGQAVTAQTPNAAVLVQQGVTYYQAGDYRSAIASWQTALTEYKKINNRPNTAIVLENLARAYQHLNQSQQAIAHWEQLITLQRQQGNLPELGRAMTEQAQVYSRIGQPRTALALLCNADNTGKCTVDSAVQLAIASQDKTLQAAALGSLGDTYRLLGEYDSAIAKLQTSLSLAQTIDNPNYRASALNSLATAHISRAFLSYRRANSAEQRGDSDKAKRLQQKGLEDDTTALKYLQESLKLAQVQNNPPVQMRALLSSIPGYYRTNNPTAATATLQQATKLLAQLPDSRDRVYAALDLARLVQSGTSGETISRVECPQGKAGGRGQRAEGQSRRGGETPPTAGVSPEAENLIQQAVAISERLQDSRAASFAVGELGHLYECRADYAKAAEITQKARWAAEQDLGAKDSLYLWEWQTGRILKAQGKITEAISAYQRAIATLEPIRSDILTANRDLQFDFRDTVEPVYRELVGLRLSLEEKGDKGNKGENSPLLQNLPAVLNTMDSLKLAELQNYFGNDCVLAAVNRRQGSLTTANTAVFSSIILPNRTAIVVSLPNNQQRFTWINVDSEEIRRVFIDYRRGLEAFFEPFDPKRAQQLYDWIIRPFADDLEAAQVKTLVFVQDGVLRSVPMAALHDGKQFLVEKYALATIPSLSLTDPRSLDKQNLRALALGLTQSKTIDGREFAALGNVIAELEAIIKQIPGSRELLDSDFTSDRLQKELSKQTYPILHIATHGEFGTEPQDTFLVTGDGKKLTITELETIIRSVSQRQNPIDLLTLTACQTAVGDDRAALGLAGVAVQAGAKSALASLWFISDASTAKLATDFYAGLRNSKLSKAEALRAAQLALIKSEAEEAHPAYWAPFVLVGNWL